MRRPTMTGCKSACDRRAQSSSDTSSGAASKSQVRIACARSRAKAVEKNTRTESSRSSIAVADAALGASLVTIELEDGERFKTMASIERIYDAALDAGVDRKALFIALGGGVVGDLCAFAASTARIMPSAPSDCSPTPASPSA